MTVTLILEFIAAHMGFLWAGARYRITGSEVSTSNGGDALLLVESEELRLRFVRDRGQLFLDFQPSSSSANGEWFSIDLVRRLKTGQREETAELDEGYASFVHEHLQEIEHQFSAEGWPATSATLKKLKAKRAKELFG
jgi:hypothetical protein